MEPVSQSNVCESILVHFRDDNLGLNIISRIFETYSDRQTDIVEILLSKPKTFFGMGTVPHIKRMYKANSARMKACLDYTQNLYEKKLLEYAAPCHCRYRAAFCGFQETFQILNVHASVPSCLFHKGMWIIVFIIAFPGFLAIGLVVDVLFR